MQSASGRVPRHVRWRRPVGQPTNQPTSKAGNQPANQPASQPSSQPAKEQASQPTRPPTNCQPATRGRSVPRGTLYKAGGGGTHKCNPRAVFVSPRRRAVVPAGS
eukprot:410303-Pyramimonas_sp.AAC.1